MLMLKAYFDETGSETDENVKVAGMAGCLTISDQWEVFEHEWLAALDSCGVKSPFHMKDFAHSVGQFKQWKGDQSRRDSFYNSLWDIIENINPMFIGCFVPLENYRISLTKKQRKELMGVYQQTYISCLATVLYALHTAGIFQEGVPVRVQTFFEFKAGVIGDSREIYSALMERLENGVDQVLMPPIFQPKRTLVPLQVADIVAYECHLELRRRLYNPGKNIRLGLQRMQSILERQVNFPVEIGSADSSIIFHSPEFADEVKKTLTDGNIDFEMSKREVELKTKEFWKLE